MGILNWIRRAKTEDMNNNRGWNTLLGMLRDDGCNNVFPELTQDEQLQAYHKSAIVATCLNKICTAFVEPPLQIGTGKGDEWEELETIPQELQGITDLLYRPNPRMIYSSYARITLQHLLLTGVTYTAKERNGNSISALWPYPPSWVYREIAERDRRITGYTVSVPNTTGQTIYITADDMCTMYMPDPRNPYCELSPLAAASRDYETDIKRENYIGEMLTNVVNPGLIVKAPEGLSEAEMRSIKARMDDKIGSNQRRRGSTLILAGRAIETELQEPLKDLDWHGLSNLSESRICAVFGVPPVVAQLRIGMENSPWSNMEEAVLGFYRETMVPLWKTMADYWSYQLLTLEGYGEYSFRFNLDNVRQLAEDTQQVSTRVIGEWSAGLITRNEARALLDWPALDTGMGDVLRVPLGSLEVPMTGEYDMMAMGNEQHTTEEANNAN